MSLVDNGNGMYMPVAPAGNYGGNGMFGDGALWLIVLQNANLKVEYRRITN